MARLLKIYPSRFSLLKVLVRGPFVSVAPKKEKKKEERAKKKNATHHQKVFHFFGKNTPKHSMDSLHSIEMENFLNSLSEIRLRGIIENL